MSLRIPETTLAWLSALIDGEGSVMLLRRVRSSRQPRLFTVQYRASVTISNTDPRLLREIVRKTGINRIYEHVRPPTDQNANHKRRSFTWRMVSTEIRGVTKSTIQFVNSIPVGGEETDAV